LWNRVRRDWKAQTTALSENSVDKISLLEKRRKAWQERKPLADMFGRSREEYDLSDEVKKITIEKALNKNLGVVIEKETNYLPRPFTYKRELSQQERRMLPLPITSKCKWVGLTPFPIGGRPQKVREPLGWYDGFLSSPELRGDPVLSSRIELLGNYSRYTLIEGGWATNRTLLVDMAQEPAIKNVLTVEALLESSFKRYDKFGFPEINCDISKSWLWSVTMNKIAFPGTFTSQVFGGTKEKAYGGMVETARRIWDKIVTSRNGICDLSVWAVGGRARRQDMSKGKAPESRIVLMPEGPRSIISGVLATPLYKEFKRVVLCDPSKECFMGHDTTLGGWGRIRDFTAPGNQVLELDWNKFDSTVLEPVMVAAFCLLRSCFPVSSKIDKIFLYVMSGFIYKNVAIKQRFIYRITQGLPSGDPLTSIMVTVCNWICLNHTLLTTGIFGVKAPDDFKLAVAGDDTLISFNSFQGFRIEDAETVCRVFRETVNLRVKPEDLNFEHWGGGDFHSLEDAEYAPSLLKTTIWHGLPGRRVEDIVKVLTCPEGRVCDHVDIFRLLQGYTRIPITNPLGRAFIRQVSNYIARVIDETEGWRTYTDVFNAFSDTYYDHLSDELIVMESVQDRAMRDPPFLKSDKWKGEVLSGMRRDLALMESLELFGVLETRVSE